MGEEKKQAHGGDRRIELQKDVKDMEGKASFSGWAQSSN